MRALCLVLPFVLAASAPAQTVLLRFKPPVGTTVSYTMTMVLTQNLPGTAKPMAFSQSVPMTVRVLASKGGTTTLQTTTGQARVTLPAGSPLAASKAAMEKGSGGTTATTQVDELGNLRSVGASGPAAGMARRIGAGMMTGAQGVAYPKAPLKVGDTWTAQLEMGKVLGGVMGGAIKAKGAIPIVYRLAGIERRGGRTFARIAVTMKGTSSVDLGTNAMRMTLDTTGSMLVDAATGLLDRMTTASTTDMAMGAAGQKMRQSMVMTMTAR